MYTTTRRKQGAAMPVRPHNPQNLPILTLTFVPQPGAVLHQPLEPAVTQLILNTPFGFYQASVAPAQPGSSTRTLQSVNRLA